MWRKSSRSYANGNCVEALANWRKSSRSTYNQNCVEVATAGTVRVRDSKDPQGPVSRPLPAPSGQVSSRQ